MICQDGTVELVRRRETMADIFALHHVPRRFAPAIQ
jgi:hypothetical protein